VGLRSSLTLAEGVPVDKKFTGAFEGVVQLYYRSNYHWYLKQQWRAKDLCFIMFDNELVNRFYMAQSIEGSVKSDKCIPGFRVVEFNWDVSVSATSDSTCLVIDGNRLLFTPLGLAIVPPPMSLFEVKNSILENEASCCKYSSFWVP
jgi:elongator complex protein 1